jgi:sialate O-acetylesterase
MEWPLSRTHNPDQAIATAKNPKIRLYTVPKLKAASPTNNLAAQWVECSPESVKNFSAVAYYFGRDLQKNLDVPIGLIHTSWGGSPAEAWTRREILAMDPLYRDILESYPESFRRYEQALTTWEKEQGEAKASGQKFEKRRPGAPWRPSELYNGMIAPLIPYPIKGAIWYQGESNAGRAHQYRSLFPDMIWNWRSDWRQGDFPFLAVQLAPFKKIKDEPGESDWAELREAQLLATLSLPKVGLAVITDVGDEDDIHPQKKEPVGARLALAARSIAYGQELVFSGPIFSQAEIEGNKVTLTFNHAGKGLEARGGELKGFSIAGEDRKFHWATAKVINSNQVVVSSPEVELPIAVRYGWADYPTGNLWNKDGLPASPFRTDDFPMITAPKPAAAAVK